MKIIQVLFILLGMIDLVFTNQVSAAEQKKYMTQGELAKRVAFISGLADGIPAPVTSEKAVSALSAQGWAPIDGWRGGAIATKDDFFVVMAKYLGLQVANPDDPKSYADALVKAGFTFGEALTQGKPTPKQLEDRDKTISKLVLDVKGTAEFKDGAEAPWAKLGKLQLVREGMSFRTGKESYVDVVYARGAAQRIYENSEVTVEMLKEEVVNGQPVRAVVVYISKGEAVSLVDPMNKSSQFVMKDPVGKFEVDKAAGSQFSVKISDEQSITLNDRERRLAGGHSMMVEVQPRKAVYVVGAGSGRYNPVNGNPSNLANGQSMTVNFLTAGANGQPQIVSVTIGAGANLGTVISAIQQVAVVLNNTGNVAFPGLLTSSELQRALGGINGVTATIQVTPIQP